MNFGGHSTILVPGWVTKNYCWSVSCSVDQSVILSQRAAVFGTTNFEALLL